MSRIVQVDLPDAIVAQIEQEMLASGKPADRLIAEAIEQWLSSRRGRASSERAQQLITALKSQGVFRDPLPQEIAISEAWNRLSKSEQAELQRELEQLPAGPMVSDIVIESRKSN